MIEPLFPFRTLPDHAGETLERNQRLAGIGPLLQFLDSELKNRPYIAGNDFTIADITALTAVDFMKVPKLPLPDEFANVRRWHANVSARPSATA